METQAKKSTKANRDNKDGVRELEVGPFRASPPQDPGLDWFGAFMPRTIPNKLLVWQSVRHFRINPFDVSSGRQKIA